MSETRSWPFLLIVPSLLVILLVVLYPTLHGISLSFREMRLTRPDLGTGFVGLRHYVDLWHDDIFWRSLANTFKWVTLAVSLELAMGMISALALNREGPLMRICTVLVLLPWFLPNVVAANMWALMLDARLGVVNELLVRMGLIDSYVAWFATPTSGLLAAVFIEAWHGYPFFTLLILAGLKAIPKDLYQAASVDGAGSYQAFRNITLPMLRMIVVTAVILRVISLANSPELLLILTGGGPGDSTQVISLYAFKTAYESFDFGYAGALSVVTLLLLMVFCVIYLRVSRVLEK
ncbi:carbohydrate ABC transporter permease [Oceaniglobus trochenteri]|uniref:carbohydrate ABC transporter permease n=1 Tax=Oceaniglobus trochenteri TaxID=2763260 RepID=UPI001CFF7BE3|nr:sugar ABC transporter permease [Oceaniglobus trochenteri]